MKNRKIFISINFDDATKRYISQKIAPLKDVLNASWTKPEQFHVTLSFLGFVEDEIVGEICQQTKAVLENTGSFDLFFDSLEVVPSLEKPKMLWLRGTASPELLKTREIIDETIAEKISKKKEFELRPHITLARLKRKQNIDSQQLGRLLGKISIKTLVPATSADVMESVKEKGVWKQYLLEKIEL